MGRKNSEERREEIVDALLSTMAEHGYAKASLSKVAAAAGLTQGLLHYHFKSKQEILVTLTERLVDAQLASMEAAVLTKKSAPEKLKALLDAFLAVGETADPDAVAAWVTIGAESIRQPKIQAEFEKALHAFGAQIAAIIEAGVEDGEFDPGEVSTPACVAAILAVIQGYFTLAATAREVIPAGSAALASWQMVQGLVGLKTIQGGDHGL